MFDIFIDWQAQVAHKETTQNASGVIRCGTRRKQAKPVKYAQPAKVTQVDWCDVAASFMRMIYALFIPASKAFA
jgi:hypothetical protein